MLIVMLIKDPSVNKDNKKVLACGILKCSWVLSSIMVSILLM